MKTFYITDDRFKFIAWILFLMFIIFMFIIVMKANELTNHACSICAEKIGQNVVCYIGDQQRTFYTDFRIEDSLRGGG